MAAAYLQFYYSIEIKDFFGQKFWRRVMLGSFMLGFGWILMTKNNFPKFDRETGLIFLLQMGTLTSLLFGGVILYLINTKSIISKWFSHPYFALIASIGYGAYLVHTPILNFFIRWEMKNIRSDELWAKWIFIYVLTLMATFAMSYCLHILVEKPVLVIRDYLLRSNLQS
jgi:peptidoglycan/LPS O-acetylase OafA/YrhL